MSETDLRRPNIILFITDQQRADFLGCYGHPVLKTPHIDRIAAGGIAFDRFYVASPVCMPNRASLMTGRMPSVHHVRANGIPLPRGSVTFVELLHEAGYATALIGKSHLQNFTGRPPLLQRPSPRPGFHSSSENLGEAFRFGLQSPSYEQEGPDFWNVSGAKLATPYYGFEHVELVTGHGDEAGGDYSRWLLERAPDAAGLVGAKNALPHNSTCPQAYRTAVPADLSSTSFIAERSRAYLETQADDEPRPFFLMVSFPDPHHPFAPPGPYWDLYQPEQFPVPEAFARHDWVAPPHVQALLDQRADGRANLQGMNSIAVSAREAQEAQALTCGMITCVDDAIGEIMSALGDRNDSDATVVIFTTDHGDHLGDHRLLLKGAEQYQQIVRVPFIWFDPQCAPSEPRSAALASTVDISATILERARVAPYIGIQGRSLLPVVRGDARRIREAVLVQYDHQREAPGLGVAPRVHSLIDDRWRLSLLDQVPWGELYDLERDPGEFVNLWDEPSRQAVKATLIEALLRAEIEHVDRSPLPTGLA